MTRTEYPDGSGERIVHGNPPPLISGRQKGLIYLAGVLPSDDGRRGPQGFGENARKGYKEGYGSVYDPRSGQEKD